MSEFKIGYRVFRKSTQQPAILIEPRNYGCERRWKVRTEHYNTLSTRELEWGEDELELFEDAPVPDPLDEAIVKAAIVWELQFNGAPTRYGGAVECLHDAVIAKLDANKPKTPEELVYQEILNYGGMSDNLNRAATRGVIHALREAGMLTQ